MKTPSDLTLQSSAYGLHVKNGTATEDWTYTYDTRGNIATVQDAVSGWSMRTLERDIANRVTQIAGNSGQANIGELGNDPVSPPANVTGLQQSDSGGVPGICVECYLRWKVALTEKLFDEELGDAIPAWGETTELILSNQSQVPYPVLVPDLTSSAKRSMLYSSQFAANGDGGGMVKRGGRDAHEAKCHDMYEADLDACRLMAKPRGERNYVLCKENAFERYQQCRGY